MPYKIEDILHVASKYDIPVIEDAADSDHVIKDRLSVRLDITVRCHLTAENDNHFGGWGINMPDDESKKYYVVCNAGTRGISVLST